MRCSSNGSDVLRVSGGVVVAVSPVSESSVDDALNAVARLIREVPNCSGQEASEQLARVDRLAAMVDALRVDLVAVVKTSEIWRESDPNGTPASFLRREHRRDHRQASADLRAAEAFVDYPQLANAAREGSLSGAEVATIVSFGTRNQSRRDVLPEFIDIFIELAMKVSVAELKSALVPWANQIDPLAAAADDHDAHQRRELFVHQLSDGVKLDGFFGAAQGAKVMAALNAALTARWRENAGGGEGGGDTVDGVESGTQSLACSTAAQRADAFVEGIIDPILESGRLPTCGGSPATITLLVPFQRLADPSGPAPAGQVKEQLMAGTLNRMVPSLQANNGPGEFVISGVTAQQLSCDGTVQRVVMSPAGKPLDVGRRTRVIPEQIRAALIVRDGGCRFPYCTKPAGWTEGHHVRHWGQGGETALDNLVLLCSKHHHQVHFDGLQIEFDKHGIPHVRLEHIFRDRTLWPRE